MSLAKTKMSSECLHIHDMIANLSHQIQNTKEDKKHQRRTCFFMGQGNKLSGSKQTAGIYHIDWWVIPSSSKGKYGQPIPQICGLVFYQVPNNPSHGGMQYLI